MDTAIIVIIIFVCVLLLSVATGTGYYFYTKSNTDTTQTPDTSISTQAPDTVTSSDTPTPTDTQTSDTSTSTPAVITPVQNPVIKPILVAKPAPPAPVDCEVSNWSAWNQCNKICGGGTQTRTRSVTTESANGGRACPGVTESQSCNTQACPPPPAPTVNKNNTGTQIANTARFTATSNSNICFDLPNGNTANETRLQLYSCNGTAAQNFGYNWGTQQILHGPTGKCVDVKNGSSANGTAIQLYDCNNTASQKWTVKPMGNPPGILQSYSALGKCLDIPNSDIKSGNQLQLYDCNGTNAQFFTNYA